MKITIEKIPPVVEASFRYFETRGAQFYVPLHYHPEWEIVEIVRGDGYRLIGDHRDDFGAGDVVVMGASLPHAYFSYPTSHPANDAACARVIQFDGATLQHNLQHFPEYPTVAPFLEEWGCGIAFKGAAAARASALLQQIAGRSGFAALVCFLDLVYSLGEASPAERQVLSSVAFAAPAAVETYHLINEACSYLHQHFDKVIMQATVAERVGLSVSAFSRMFGRLTGRSFPRYLNELRIGHACKQMLETEKSIAQIAADCGYPNLSNFNRCFLALKHMPPREYRAQLKA
jgi:AraC-like DNA-binding protein